MANITFANLADGFGVVTVMNVCIYKLRPNISYVGRGACAHAKSTGGALTKDDFVCTGLYLDTLKIANLTMEGPTKTVTGGQYANPLIKYGKTMTAEMQDALGRAGTLVEFFGCEYIGDPGKGRISVTDKFPGAFAIEGDTFFIDQKSGEKVPVHIFIPQFLPDGIFNLTQDAEGDATVFDCNGTVSVTKIKEDDDAARDIFYEIREEPFFYDMDESGTVTGAIERAEDEEMDGYHSDESVNAGEIGLAAYKKEKINFLNTYVALDASKEDKVTAAIEAINAVQITESVTLTQAKASVDEAVQGVFAAE